MHADDATADKAGGDGEVLALRREELAVGTRRIVRGTVRVETVVRTHEEQVSAELTHHRVHVERVPVGRFVDAVPPVREDGELTVMPVVEEVLVVERRLLLREEVHIRRVHEREQHDEVVLLRREDVIVARRAAEPGEPRPLTHTIEE